MVYDCFTFFNEIDLLEIRLCLMYDHVDKFVIVEANKTHSNKPKPLFFEENKVRFEKYSDKIIYIKADDLPDSNNPWDLEISQRESIKRGLINCMDEDIIIISDLDELIDPVLLKMAISEPTRVHMHFYYYFINCQVNEIWEQAYISPYKFIRDKSLSFLRTNSAIIKKYIPIEESGESMHLSYLYGYDLEKYIIKLKNFAHQEYNKLPFISLNHLSFCLKFEIDILIRNEIKLSIVNNTTVSRLASKLKNNKIITDCIYKKSTLRFFPKKTDYDAFFYIYLQRNSLSFSGPYSTSLKIKVLWKYLLFLLSRKL